MTKRRILLVDDEGTVTRTLKLYLEGTGKFDVRAENRGRDAVKAARDFKPDLMLLDVIMPDIDGSEVAELMQQDQELKTIPIVFLTALVSKAEVGSTGTDIGGHPFLAKPIDPERVVECIERNVRP
jgi:CheY-like chemotaxis protein